MAKKLRKINSSSNWFENTFKIERGLFGPPDLGEDIFAHLLQDLEKFYLDLIQIRKVIGVVKIIPFPKDPSVKELILIKMGLKEEQIKGLEKEVRSLAAKIGVTENWLIPLEVLVLMNVLPIPKKQEAFTLYIPGTMPPLPFFDPTNNYPKILIQRSFSFEELDKWIEENKELLKKVSGKLPKDPSRSNNRDTLVLARIIFILKEIEGKTSKQIADLLPEIFEKTGSESPDRTIDYKEVDDLYNTYKKYLNSIYKSGS